MDNKILIMGSGYIGSRLKEELDALVSDKIISNYSEAEEEVLKFKPKIIINCIGYTGRNVDECELDKNTTLLANTFLPIMLAEVALRHNIKLVHISSGCIYHYDYANDKPIREDKIPDYLDLYYSRTKVYSELSINALLRKYPFLVVRIRIPLDNRSNPKNLLNKLIKYQRIIDLPNSVTYIPDFVRAMRHLISINATGIYNLVNKGALKYPELMDVYRKYVPGFKYSVIKIEELGIVRTNLILSTEKLEKSGFNVRDIHDILDECIQGYLGDS
ncbi:MAG: sugar nucleotide-binding protein [Candidatus Omnitrophota bacterium]